HAGFRRRLERDLVDHLAGLEVHRPQRAVGGDAALLGAARRQADVVLLLVHRRLVSGRGDAALGAGDVGDAALGVERRREEGGRAVPPRAGLFAALVTHHADTGVELDRRVGIVVDRLAGLRVDALRPGDLLLVLISAQELTAVAVERVVIAIAREV